MAALHQHRCLQHTKSAARQSEQLKSSHIRSMKLTACSGGGIEPSLSCSCSSSNTSKCRAGVLRTIHQERTTNGANVETSPCVAGPCIRQLACPSISRASCSSKRAVAAAAAGKGPIVVIDNYDSFTYNLVQVRAYAASERLQQQLSTCSSNSKRH
jgi:hypothetical protein